MKPLCPTLLFSALSLGMIWNPSPAHADTIPSADSLITKCEQAYDKLQSYSCHTAVATTSTGTVESSSSDIVFVRPGSIRAEGLDSGGNKYGYISNGTSTWELNWRSKSAWEPGQSAEMAIAGATGIAQDAATTIPALLLRTNWGYPFIEGIAPNTSVVTESVNGQPCYRVSLSQPIEYTFWIDRKTFLLDKVVNNFSGIIDTQTITNQKINPTVPPATFTTAGK